MAEGSHKYPVIELVDRRVGQLDLANRGMQAVIGGWAFRGYGALSETIRLNTAGNLRGMVVSAKWQTVFRYSSEVGEYLETVGYLAALVSGIAEAGPTIQKVLGSSDSAVVKGMQMSATAGTIAQRALLGVVPAGSHMIYRSLEGWCMIAGLPGGKAESAASQCIKTLQYADTLVSTTFRTVTDTGNQAKAVWWVIDLVTSARPK